ncbi:MAG TPA: hypothetical protein VFN77_06605, partial [Acetobacteraceae bacterium]|nr:hypothetical protein [Acetobacteraceae bacterium]
MISGFRAGRDQLQLTGSQSVVSSSVSGGNLNLMLNDGTQISLVGITSVTSSTSGGVTSIT